jgi:hypothetical protein
MKNSASSLTKLEEAMIRQMTNIVNTEYRPFSHLDFTSDEVKGEPYAVSYGTFRNKISKFIMIGLVEFEFSSGVAFYTIKGIHFGKKKVITHPDDK